MIDNNNLRNIFSQLKNNENDIFAKFCVDYHKLIYGISFSICKNEADSEDIVQNVLFKIYRIDKEKLPENNELSWLYKVTKNETIDYLRKQNNHLNIDELYDIGCKCDDIEKIVDKNVFENMIKNLGYKEKEIISLKILSEFSFDEIADMLKEPSGTVKWRYYKSIKSLKLCLANSMLSVVAFIFGTYKSVNYYSSLNNEYSINSKEDIKENFDDSQMFFESSEQDFSLNLSSNNINYGFTFSAIFLIFSIVFAIIFKKHQLKLKRKTFK